MSLFRRSPKHALPTHAGDVHVPPPPGGVEEALLRLQDVPGFDLDAFLVEASSVFVRLRPAIWGLDAMVLSELCVDPLRERLVRQAEVGRSLARRLAVEGFEVRSVDLVRAPGGSGLSLTVRVLYVTTSERVVHLVSGALLEDRYGSHHREDLTLTSVDGRWRASGLSVLS